MEVEMSQVISGTTRMKFQAFVEHCVADAFGSLIVVKVKPFDAAMPIFKFSAAKSKI